jgi:hypothetical protein
VQIGEKEGSMRSTRARLVVGAAVAAVAALAVAGFALAGNGGKNGHGERFFAQLKGFNETPSLNGGGKATMTLDVTSDQLTFALDYSGLSGPPLVAHVHIGQRGVAGGVSFFLCGGGGKPACPASPSGSISGTVVAADVVGPTTQGFDPGDLGSVVKAIEAGVAYANMHTTKFPAGEIRGQLTTHLDRNDKHGGD